MTPLNSTLTGKPAPVATMDELLRRTLEMPALAQIEERRRVAAAHAEKVAKQEPYEGACEAGEA
jgi:hypothetical protein